MLLVTDATVITMARPHEVLEHQDLLVSGKRIAAMAQRRWPPWAYAIPPVACVALAFAFSSNQPARVLKGDEVGCEASDDNHRRIATIDILSEIFADQIKWPDV